MKKLVALLLTGTLFLSGCQLNQPTIPDEGISTEQSTPSVVEESEESPSAESDTPEQSGRALPTISIESVSVQRYTEDGETLLVDSTLDNMTLSGDGYEKAAEAVREHFYSSEDELSEQADQLKEWALEQYMDTKDEGYWFSPYGYRTTYEVTRLDTGVLSVKSFSYDYEGGAHGYGAEWGTTIDLESGAELALSQLASDAPGFMNKVVEVVLKGLSEQQDQDELFDNYEAYVKQNIEETNWYLDAAGIVMVYTPYEIGPYAAGSISVRVPYEEVADYMKPEYLMPQEAYIIRLPREREVTLELEGGTCTVFWTMEHVGPYDDYETVVTVNGGESLVEPFVWVQHAYLMRRPDGRSFLIFDIDWASDDYETFVYELSADGAVQTADIWAALDGKNINTDGMKMKFSLYVLGTYFAEMQYALTEDGGLEPLEEIFDITPNREWQGLVTVRELPVTVDGQQTTLPAGTSLYIEGTDNEGTAWFITAEDSGVGAISGEIHYERREDDYQLYIDGVSEYEYFEMLPYAG